MSRLKQQGFSAVELLITLFVAAAFVVAGFQLYDVVVKDGGQARATSRASNVAYDYLRRYEPIVTDPCTPSTPLEDAPITASGLSNVTVTITIECPYAATTGTNDTKGVSKIIATVKYNSGKVATYSTYSVRLNEGPPPSPPILSSSVTLPSTPVFTWPAVTDATGYTVTYRIGSGGAWKLYQTNDPNRTVTINNDPEIYHDATIYVRVIAINENGGSIAAESNVNIPLWGSVALQNSWTNYGGAFAPPRYTKTSEGIVVLSGLIAKGGNFNGGEVLFQLPVGYRPNVRQIYTTITNANASARVDVDADGSVRIQFGNNGYLSLDGIKFVPSVTTALVFQPMTYSNNWVNYDNTPTHQVGSYTKDTLNRTFTRGVIRSGSTTAASLITALPAGYQSPDYLHLPTFSGAGFSLFSPSQTNSTYAAGAGLQFKAGASAAYFSVEGMFYNSYAGWTDISYPMASGWTWYDSAGIFPKPGYIKAADNLVTLKGLIRSGTTTSDSVMFTLPEGYRPSARLIFEVANNSAVGRVDVLPTGEVRILTGGNTWLALDSISFIAEQ